jgi:hypothetical protein
MRRPSKAYLSALGALYGETPPSAIPKRRSLSGEKRKHPELDMQIMLCDWLTLKGVLFYAVPNGGKRHPFEALNFKLSGVKAGVPDICIPVPRKSYGGLYIELKSSGGIVSSYQQEWIKNLTKEGNQAVVCYSFEEAKKIVSNYFDFKD